MRLLLVHPGNFLLCAVMTVLVKLICWWWGTFISRGHTIWI